ncbi:hypothetical protein ADK67_47095 [Saccharothrix sp. NRRL B-16348]|uniref:hypothetical protein n=1 Tax=Saccharothrix sp. NRRL B-16348 TaxID=1415542 RepID=UPI0006B036CA|nr:hypothetical protein [Saccharothrix sp. NRRL B-16348]KOX12583.1 hypothetical protein ADK67_47095 [Saccharothrix sp. NRRL B-16348]
MAPQNVPSEDTIAVVSPYLDVALPEAWNWAAYDHRTLYESVHVDNDPGQAGALAQEWLEFGEEMVDSAQLMRDCLVAGEEGWQGESAESARGAIRELADWSEVAALTAADLGQRVGEQARIMAEARAAMPEPVDFDWHATLTDGFATGGMAGFAAALVDVKNKSDQATSAHHHAVLVMARMEEQSRAVDTASPWFSPPPDPVTGSTTTLWKHSSPADGELSTTSEPLVRTTVGTPAGEVTVDVPNSGGYGGSGGLSDPDAVQPAGTTSPTALPALGAPAAQWGPPGLPSAPLGQLGLPAASPGQVVALPFSAPSPGMPDLDVHKPGGPAAQGVLATSSFTAPSPGVPGGPSTVDQHRPGWTAPQSSAGGPGFGAGDPGGSAGRLPNRDGHGPGGTSPWTSRGTANVPAPDTAMPRNGGGGGGEGGRGGAGPRGSINVPADGDPRNRMAYTPPNSGPSGTGPALPRPGGPGMPGGPGVPGTAGMAGGGMPGGAGGGQGAEDEERKAKYVGGERFFEVSDADLAPSVIGGRAPGEQQGQGGRS